MKNSVLSRLWLGLFVALLSACNLNSPQGTTDQTISGVPVVEIISPAPNNTYLEGVGVSIQASVSNAGADIARVEFTMDNTIVGTAESPNTAGSAIFSVSQRWTATGEGEHTAGVTAFRADGTSSAPVTVSFTVIRQAAVASATPQPDNNGQSASETTGGGGQATQRPAATATSAQPTEVPPTDAPAATPTPSVPMITVNQGVGVNVRSGPSTLFNPALAQLPAAATAEIIAVNPNRDWYRIQTPAVTGWVFSSNVTTSGDLSTLPIEQGPPLPTAVPPTAVPPTVPPVGGITGGSCSGSVAGASNLCVVSVVMNGGGQPFCGTATNVVVTVGNNGGAATGTGFFVTATITRADNSTVFTNTNSTSNIIQPGGNTAVTVGGSVFTHMTGGGQTFRVTITFNANGNADTNTADSTYSTTYVLGGTC
jgi:hypothetical protein